jgi:hypothetical protein
MLMVATLFPVATGGSFAVAAAELGAAGKAALPVWATAMKDESNAPITKIRVNMLVI